MAALTASKYSCVCVRACVSYINVWAYGCTVCVCLHRLHEVEAGVEGLCEAVAYRAVM